MSLPLLLAIAMAGAAGAATRYSVTQLLNQANAGTWRCGTNIVNLSGSLALGLLLGLALSREVPPSVVVVIGVGFLGAYTTFSTWMYETVKLIESGAWRATLVNVLMPVIVGPAAAFVGIWLGMQF